LPFEIRAWVLDRHVAIGVTPLGAIIADDD
jgi:hypothetical protein